jgi:hypothetical protein
VGQAITGGYVYRGAALGAANFGRYFFADFEAGRVWSLGLDVNQVSRGRRGRSPRTPPNWHDS